MWGDGWVGELGSEPTLELYIEHLVEVFREVKRVLRDDGTLWLNMGDSYACSPNGRSAMATKAAGNDDRAFRDKPFGTAGNGLKPKDLCGVPWRVALALQADGWYLRADCIWSKSNPMPSSVKDRPAMSHEYVFLLSKKAKYYYDNEAVREKTGREASDEDYAAALGSNKGADADRYGKGYRKRSKAITHPAGRNRRTVWKIDGTVWEGPTQPFNAKKVGVEDVDHFSTFPEALVETPILAGTSEGGGCAACGAPYRRLVEGGEPDREWQLACGGNAQGEYHGQATKDFASAGAEDASAVKARILAGMVEKRTVGWEPTCRCGALVSPCIVCDPFAGSGTVGVVAARLGRHAMLLELNESYCNIARRRCGEAVREEA